MAERRIAPPQALSPCLIEPARPLLPRRQVWEVEWGREGCKGVPRAMDLKGHTRKVGVRVGCKAGWG